MYSGQINYQKKRLFRKPKESVFHFECVENWDEINGKQLEVLTRLILTDMTVGEQKTILFHSLSNIPKNLFVLFNEYQIMSLYDCVDPFFEDPELTNNLWPSFKILGKTYHGPGNMFGRMSVDEFIKAEDYYFDYLEETRKDFPDEEKLENLINCLVATLWREKDGNKDRDSSDFNGDWRVSFNQHHIATRAVKLKRLPAYRKLGMLFYYQGCRNALVDLYEGIFDTEKGASESADRETWIKMLSHLPNDKFGTIDRIGPMNLLTVLYFCNLFILEAKKAKK